MCLGRISLRPYGLLFSLSLELRPVALTLRPAVVRSSVLSRNPLVAELPLVAPAGQRPAIAREANLPLCPSRCQAFFPKNILLTGAWRRPLLSEDPRRRSPIRRLAGRDFKLTPDSPARASPHLFGVCISRGELVAGSWELVLPRRVVNPRRSLAPRSLAPSPVALSPFRSLAPRSLAPPRGLQTYCLK